MQRFLCKLDYEGPGRQETILASKGMAAAPVDASTMDNLVELMEGHGALFAEWLVSNANRHFIHGLNQRLGPALEEALVALGEAIEAHTPEADPEFNAYLDALLDGVDYISGRVGSGSARHDPMPAQGGYVARCGAGALSELGDEPVTCKRCIATDRGRS